MVPLIFIFKAMILTIKISLINLFEMKYSYLFFSYKNFKEESHIGIFNVVLLQTFKNKYKIFLMLGVR